MTDNLMIIKSKLYETTSPTVTKDYNKLENKPSINGVELVGNYDEIDPTVPAWAKEPNKPTYDPSEIGAINVDDNIPDVDIADMIANIFNLS